MKRNIIKDLKLNEISAVTIPAQSHALATILKGEHIDLTKYLSTDDGAKSFDAFMADEVRQKYKNKIGEELWPLLDALRNSIISIRIDASLNDDEKQEKIGESVAQFMTASQHPSSNAISANELMKLFTNEDSMSEINELEARIAELTKRAEKAESVAKMTEREREFMSQLDEEAAEEFRAAAKEKRDAMMKKSAESDEVFKSAEGVEVRKSAVGDAMFAILKSQDAALRDAKTELAKAADRAQTAELTKRAEDEFNHLPGETVAKVAVLKGLASLDADAQATLTAMLKAGNEALKPAFVEIGKSGGRPQDITKAAKRDELIKAHMSANPNVTKAQAEVAVISANPELYEA